MPIRNLKTGLCDVSQFVWHLKFIFMLSVCNGIDCVWAAEDNPGIVVLMLTESIVRTRDNVPGGLINSSRQDIKGIKTVKNVK